VVSGAVETWSSVPVLFEPVDVGGVGPVLLFDRLLADYEDFIG